MISWTALDVSPARRSRTINHNACSLCAISTCVINYTYTRTLLCVQQVSWNTTNWQAIHGSLFHRLAKCSSMYTTRNETVCDYVNARPCAGRSKNGPRPILLVVNTATKMAACLMMFQRWTVGLHSVVTDTIVGLRLHWRDFWLSCRNSGPTRNPSAK